MRTNNGLVLILLKNVLLVYLIFNFTVSKKIMHNMVDKDN